LAVALAAMRLFPMTATVVPLFRGSRPRPWLELAAVHFVAITTWIEANRRLTHLAADMRLPYQLGMGLGISAVMLLGALAGYVLAGTVPPLVSAALLFLTPLYFLLSLMATSRSRMDVAAIAAGCALAPILYVVVPGIDLLATGLLGGTVAFVIGRARVRGGST
jgi:predicted branched-subunit amino acid permease